MTGPGVVALAAALALVLSFGMLREARLAATSTWLRWHLAATALGTCAAAFQGGRSEAAVLLGGTALLLVLALRIGAILAGLDRRTGAGTSDAGRSASLPLIAIGLGLTALAVLAVAGSRGIAADRETTALGLAVTLLGLVSASRAGVPATCLARFVSATDGLVLLACVPPLSTASSSFCLLLVPSALVVATSTIGRAGGLP